MGSSSAAAWDRSKWIGYEDREHKLVREADAAWITNPHVEKYEGLGADTRHDFRIAFTVEKPVKRATLYATGEDTASAWINGAEIFSAQPLPPYAQMPWKKYVSGDATAALKTGSNLLSIEVVLYAKPRSKNENLSRTPMKRRLVRGIHRRYFASLPNGDGQLEIHPSTRPKNGTHQASTTPPGPRPFHTKAQKMILAKSCNLANPGAPGP